MKNKKVLSKTKYAIYLLMVHLICILFTISKIMIPSWGHWLETTRFLWTSFPTYVCVLVAVFPMVCFWPYLISADFKPGTAKTLLATFGLIVGNVTLILIYTTILNKVL